MQFHTFLALSTLALAVLGAAFPVADPVAGDRKSSCTPKCY